MCRYTRLVARYVVLFKAALTLLASCRTATSKRMYSAAAFRVSTLLGFRSGLISGTIRFRRKNMVFKFLIYRRDADALHPRWHGKCYHQG